MTDSTDFTDPNDDPLLRATTLPQELSFFGYFQSLDKIGISGTAMGFANGTEVNLLIVDIMGNSQSVNVTIQNGSFEVSDIDATQFTPGDLTLTATAGNILSQSTLLLEELLPGDPIVIDQPVLNGLNELTIEGQAPSLQPNDVVTLEVRDSLGAKITATAVVQADGTFSVQDLSTQGLKEGVLVIDVKALTSNGAISVVNAASVLLANMTPEGADATLQATEDTALVITVDDFGYNASGGYLMTGVKIAGLPAQGTLTLNGVAVVLDQFVSVAQLDAEQLVFQAAPNANGNNYANFKFKVMDSRSGSNEDLVANTLTINVAAVNDATVVANLIPDQVATYNAPFSYTVPANTFSDVDSTLTYSATLGSDAALPAWLTFNAATRTFSGTPPNALDINLKVIASDGTNSVSDVFRVAIAPAVTSLAVVSATGVLNDRLNAGDVATIEVNFIEAVTVTGTPQLALNIGGTLVQANYVSGSGGTKLTFKYTVQAGQNDANGISIDANALTLNGGTIKDVHGNNAILNTLAVADNTNFKVDTENLRTVSADGMDKNFSQADDTTDTWVVYSDGTTKGNNLYVTVAGTESLQQAQMRIDGGAWTNMTLSGNKAVFHFNTALTAGDHAFDFRTLDLAGNYSAVTTQNMAVSSWSSLPTVTTVTTSTVSVPNASTGQALLGNGSVQTFTLSKAAIGSYLNNGADNLFLQGGSTGDAGSGTVVDHLTLTGDGAVLNLTDLLGGGYTVDKVQGFEFLDMRASGKQAIVADAVSLGSVSTSGWLSNSNLLAGYYAMVVRGDAEDTLVINKGGAHDFTGFVAAGTSTNAGNFIVDGITYDIYRNDTTKQYLLVQQGVQVSIWRPSVVGAPVNIVPLSVTALQETTKAITDISVEDINGNLSKVQLTVLNGTVSVTLSGTTVSAGALNSSSVTLTGTQAQLNAALATLTYKGDAAFAGTDTLTIVSTDSTGTPLSDTDTVNITVASSNTAPVPNPATGLVDNPLIADAPTTLTITDNATGNAGNFVTSGTTVAQGLVRYTLTFNEAIDAATLTEADIRVSNGTLKAGSLVRVGTTNAWTVDVQAPATGNGATSVSIVDGAYNSATGMAGQGNSATQAYGTFGLSPLGSAPISHNNNMLTADRAMTYLPDGGWVTLAYNNGLGGQYNVNAFKFDATGALVKQSIVGTGTAIAIAQHPAIVTLENGDLLMTYSTSNLATGLVVQRLDTDLNALGAAINPATNTTAAKNTPAITALPGGGYFVSWVSTAQDGSFGGVYGQVFDANSNKVGSEILVNTTTISGQTAPSVDAFSDGSFIVTWSSGNASTATSTLNAQFFNANGSKKGVERTLATGDTPSDSVVRVLSDGKYVVSWKTADMVSGFGYFTKFQVYNADGTASGGLVNLTGASKQAPSIAALAGGGFAVAWAEAPVSSGFNTQVNVQVYANTGAAVGTKYQSPLVNTSEQNYQFPNLTALPNGGYALSYDTSGTTRTIYNQVFAAPGGSFLSGATPGAIDTFIGGDSVDVITANGGADIIHAGAGDDTVILNADNITKLAAANSMVVHGGTGASTLKFSGTGSVLDLTNATVAAKLSHFSSIDLTGSGNNTLRINADAAKTLSGLSDNALTPVDEAKILVVNGNAGDAVQLLDPQIGGTSQWKAGATDTGADLIGNLGNRYGFVVGQSYTAYTLAGVTVYVNATVTVTDFGTPTTAPAMLVTEAQSVQTLFGTRFTDADGVGVANGQFKGVVITDAGTTTEQTTMGKYQWSTNGTTWTDFAAGLTDSTSVFLTPATLIRFQAASGVAALNQHDLSARLVDLSGNTGTSALVNGQTGVNASVNGGSTAFSGTRVTLVQSSLPPADPVFSSASTATTAENVPTSTVVYDATANSDTGMTYSFVSGADASLFVINSSTGEVRFNASPNFENKLDVGQNNVYDFTVRATNSAGAFADKAVALTVTNVNEYPVNNLSATLSASEDVSTAILGLSVSDEDGNLSTVKLTVLNGTLGVSLTGGATFDAGGNNTSTMTLSGTPAQINAALSTVTYKGNANFNGSDSLTMLATDALGLIDSNTMDITVDPVNDVPVNTVPTGKTVAEEGSLGITGISVNDIDGNLSTVQLTVTSGAVGVTLSGGVTLSAGVNNSSTLTLSGTQADINTVLATLNYQAAQDFNGTATLTVLTTDTDASNDSDTVAISVTAVNDAPVLATSNTLNYTENNAATAINNVITVADVDSATLASATVSISGGFVTGQDVLSFVSSGAASMGNIAAGAYNATTGSITLTSASSTATLAHWQAALRAVSYRNTSDNPSTATRTVSYTVNDGIVNGNTLTSTINITAVNDAPVNAVPVAQSTAEDTNKVITGLSVSDPDGNASLTVTLGITNGTLTLLTGTGVTLGGNNSTSVTLTGSVSDINNLLATTNAVTYKPTPNFSGSSTLTMTSSDGTLSDIDTVAITVTPVNDAPVIIDTVLNLATVDPVTGNPAGAVGSLVSSFMGGVSDMDAGALRGMAITGIDTSQGTLWYSTNGGTNWTEVTQTLSSTNALLIGSDADNRLYFKPVAGAANGQVSSAISFRAWDQTSGTEGSYVSTATNGGTTAFSTDIENIGQSVFHDEVPTLVGSNPSDNGYMTAVGNDITLNFSENVSKGTGLIELYNANGTLVQSFDVVSSGLVTGWGTANLTINPTSNLLANTGYYIRIAPTAVKDTTGNAYAGITDNTTLNFTTVDASGAIVVPVNGIMAIEDLSTIGDFNGDGYDDFIVGAGMNGLGSTDGAAFVVYGNANGTVSNLSGGTIAASAGFKIVSGLTGDYFGIAVNSAGDTNGDGLADLVVTAKYGDASYRESAYVVFGKSNASTAFATGLNVGTGLTASMGYQIKIDEAYWGQAVSNAGDVNGDGLSDLLVISDTSAARNVYVIYGKTGNQSVTLTSYTQFTPDMGYNVLTSNVIDLGQSVYGAGDVNGDGLADFIVGAPNSSTGARGMAYVVYGNSTGTSVQLNATNGIDASQGFRILGQAGTRTSFPYFGFAVSSAGDVNGDGLADVMISSPYDPGAAGGAVYVVYGNSSGSVLDIDLPSSSGVIAASRGFKITSALASDMLGRYGKDIASAGDINGDGLSDMIISGRDDNGNTTAGTYVVYGNASGTNVAIDASGNIAASNGFKLKGAVGFVLASAGDINGDGLNDLLVSARLSGVSGSYNVVLGGTQWVTAALDGAGTFAGTSGSEALIGSAGNDTITGGGGVDRFFAGKGDDTIVLTASDIANLQNNSTGQTAKATVSAGTGFDTIRLSGGAGLDLLKVSNAAAMGIDETSRIEGIERIDMATDTVANTLKISNKDINDMAGFNQIRIGSTSADGKTWTNLNGGTALGTTTPYHQMVIDGGSNDTVALTANGGAWANVGAVSNGTTQYTVYQNTATNSQLLVQQGVSVDTQAPTLLWSTPADNDFVLTANLGNNITLQFSEAVVKGNGYIQLWNKTTGQPVEAFDVNSSTLVTGWGTSTLTINPTANLAAATDYFVKVSDNAIQDNSGLAYTGMNSDLPLNFSTQSADGSFAVTSSFKSASDTNAYLRSVATAGDFNGDGYDDLLIGAAGPTQSGVYVIYGNAQGEGLNLDKDPIMSNGVIAADQGFKIQGRDYFGTSVAGIGDVNGDGFADVLIGASSDSQGGSNAGAAFVVYGSADPAALNLSSGTIAAARGFKIAAGTGYGSMGNSVSGVGDFNGDGIGDFIIGYAYSELTNSGGGEAYVVYGKTNASSLTLGTNGSMAAADGIRLSGAVSDRAGFSVSGAGDVNGDGLSDVIVSASEALSNADGAAYVIFGGATGGDMNALVAAGKGLKITGLTNSTGHHLGTSVSSAGDVNGDGYADLIVATDTDQSYTTAYVVYGGEAPTNVSLAASTIAAAKGFRILGNTANGAGLGQVSGAGDLNGDGFADVIVGSTNGSSYVVYGKATGAEVSVSTGTIAASQGFKLTYPTNITSTTAQDVSFAGDFDGDGLNDLVIAEDTNFGNSQTYKIVFGGTQWLTTPVIGNGAVTGTAASEAILGSIANDTLTGGGGVDRFFAGMGDDTIVLTANDVTQLGNVAAGQTAKASVNGGGGFDTLRMSGGAALNLTTITNAGAMGLEENSRIESIERIDLATDTAANTLTLTTTDVKDMAGFNLFHTGSLSADGKTWTNVSGQALQATTRFHQMVVDGGSNDNLALNAPVGAWTVEGTVSDGTSTYTVYQNASTASQVLVKSGVVVQAVGGPALLSSTPGDDGYLMALTDNLTLSFDQAVVKGTGTIELRNSSTGALVQSFDVATSTEVTGWSSNTLTINPTANLVGNTNYYLTVNPTAIKNAAGSSFAGLNNSTDLNFTTVNSSGSIVLAANPGQTSSYLGMSLSEVGDFNGDGFDDVILGARGTNNYSGAAYVVYGNATATLPSLSNGTIAASAGFRITGGTFSELGHSVSGVGDINGDGLMDVMVGTARYTTTSSTNNIAHVVYGSTNATDINMPNGTMASSLGFTLKGGDTGTDAFFGEHVSNAGDMNGDGLADLIVSRTSLDGTGIGQVYVVYGKTGTAGFDFSGQTIAASNGYRITGSSDSRGFGDTVSGGADVNGDGLADMIVSAPNEQNTAPATGAAYVIFGNSTGASYQISGTTIPSTMGFKINAEFSSSLSSVDMVGDVNGDGLADVIVGTFTAGTNNNRGASYVVYGKTSGTAVELSNVATTPSLGFKIAANTSEYFGYKVSGAGDVNGDGLMDLMVAGGAGFTNAVYVMYGSANGSSLTVGTDGTSIASSRGFLITGHVGNSVSAAGDINGDGLDDLLMGGPSNVAAGSYNVVLGGTQWVTSVVKGEGTVTGGATAEALVGSSGNDTLTGGGGVDRFLAGMGNDTITLTPNDVTNLANNATGQTAKAVVDGGNGFDTISLSGGANLDLTTITNTGVLGLKENSRIESIERLILGADAAANTLTLTARDVKDMAGFNVIHTGTASADGNVWTNTTGTALSATTNYHQLVVFGSTNDTVVFAPDTGFWTNVGTVNNGATSFIVYQNAANLTQVLVKANMLVTNNDSVAPVVLDLNRDGDLSYSQTLMDVNDDGQLDQTAWAGRQDGVLVWDKYADGLVHDNSQYAFAQYAGFAGATDLQGLAAAFDSNADGLFSNLDALYSQFAVWQDLDQDGMSDAGEVRSLADWGIAAINLVSDGVVQAPAVGVQEAGRSTAQMADGSEIVVADAAFAYQTVPQLDLAGFVAQAQAESKAQPLPAQASVKLFLYDMIQGATAAEQGSGELFAAEGEALRAPEPQHLGYHMDLLAEHLLQPPQS